MGSLLEWGPMGVSKEDLVQVQLIVVSLGSQTHPLVMSPIYKCTLRIDTLSSWHNPHVEFLACKR